MTTDKTEILHNPRCSKSRETLSLLRDHGIEPDVLEYLKAPLAESTLRQIITELDADATALIRVSDAKKTGIVMNIDSLSDDEIVKLLCEHPALLQRPIVRHKGRAIIGRPPSNVLDLFDKTNHKRQG